MADRGQDNPALAAMRSGGFGLDAKYGSGGRGLGPVQRRPGTQPIYDPYTLEEVEDRTQPEKQARLIHEMMTPNLAGNPKVQEAGKQIVQACLQTVRNHNEFQRSKFLKLYQSYRGNSLLAQRVYGQVLHSPEPYKTVENVVPRQHNALFGFYPWYKLEGIDQSDDLGAENQEALCRAQHRDMRYEMLAQRMLRDRAIYGTNIQKLYWKQDYRKVTTRRARLVPGEIEGTWKKELAKVARDEVYFDGNDACSVGIFDFFVPPHADGIKGAEWAADRTVWSAPKVRKMGELGLWLNLERLKEQPGSASITFDDEFKEAKAFSYGIFDSRSSIDSPHISHWTVIDWWGPADLHDGQGEEMANFTIIDPFGLALIVVARRNPFWHGQMPYQGSRYTPLTEEFYGIGAIEPIGRLSMVKDLKLSLFVRQVDIESCPPLIVDDSVNIADGQWIARPGGILRARNVEGVKPLFLPKTTDILLQALEKLTMEIRETTGISDATISQASARSGATATAVTADLNESNLRMLGAIATFDAEITEPMLDQMTWNNQQFMTKPKVIKLVGPSGLRWKDRYTIKPEDIMGRFLVVTMAGPRLSTQKVLTQQLINILDRAPAINQATGRESVKVVKLLAKIMQDSFGYHDVGDFLETPPEDKRLFSAIEEHELWLHREVAPVRDEDNHLRHFQMHQEFIGSDAFRQLEITSPETADEARAHTADHGIRLAREIEQSERALAMAEQLRAVQGQGNGEAGGRGFAGEDGQDPTSPKFRRESGMPKNEDGATKSEAGLGAPNQGAS